MPKYFFDCHDKGEFHADLWGCEVADHDEAAVQAACLARAIMNESDDRSGPRAVTVIVRSADDAVVYTAHCSFHGLRMPDPGQQGTK